MRPYLAMLKTRLRLHLQYRVAALAGAGTQVFWGLVRMMIFTAFYASASTGQPMNLTQVVSYIWLGQAFILLTLLGPDGELQQMIRSGNVACEFIRPVDLYTMWYIRHLAKVAAPAAMRSIPILLLATVMGWLVWPDVPTALAAGAAIVGGALLAAAISTLMTLSIFWTLSSQGIRAVLNTATFVFSGMTVPLPLLPKAIQPLLAAMPFRGLADLPFRLFTRQLPLEHWPAVLGQQLAWTAALMLLGRWVMARATRRVVVQGG